MNTPSCGLSRFSHWGLSRFSRSENGTVPFPKRRRTLHHRQRLRGTAPLEMVLCLPILLLVMALMVNSGAVSRCKVQSQVAARHAVWSSRWPRSPDRSPRPDHWPDTLSAGPGGGATVPELDHSAVDHPVTRGPWLYDIQVNRSLLDPTQAVRHGSASRDAPYPMLTRLGDYHVSKRTHLLDNKWQFQRLGLHATRQRRIPVLYVFPRADDSLAVAYVMVALDIFYAPFREDLFPLDRDDEFIEYSDRFGWGSQAPEFHPDLTNCCRLDIDESCCHDDRRVSFCCLNDSLVSTLVEDLIDRIQGKVHRDEDGEVVRRTAGVAERMTERFIRLYERVIRELNDLIAADPPPPPDEIADMRAEIVDLEDKIEILEQFLGELQNAGS